jgi:two-component system cell cycle sensor histidine kinase/response regulator CckA
MIQLLPAVTEPSMGSEAEDDCQLLDALVEGGTSVMFLKDVQGRYLRVNQRFEASFDLPREAILGRTDHELFPKDIADAFRKHDLEVMERGVPVEFEEEAPYVDGTHTSIVEKFPWRRADGSLGGVGGLALDITARKRAEAERKELEARMVRAEKLESLGILAGGIAHDFNNLLTGILGNAELALHSDELPARTRSALLAIQRSAGRAADLTRQMLAYSGRATFQRARESISAPRCARSARCWRARSRRRSSCGSNSRATCRRSTQTATQLQQVVMNLLTNASEALEGRRAARGRRVARASCRPRIREI